MSNKNDPPAFDPDTTLSGPLGPDPEATISGPLGPDPEATVSLKGSPLREPDAAPKAPGPDVAAKPVAREDDPEATFSGPMALFDPDATISKAPGGRRRANPFAPKALPEALQANLAALGGLNQLIAFANPILSAVPQIRAARSHPDPGLLKETLQDLVEAFEAGASKAGFPDETLEGAVYALCCLADDAAASTSWGKDWAAGGLLHEMRGEDNGGEEFFALLEATKQKPDENADLLEFLYVCLALGFEGGYRNASDGVLPPNSELARIRADLHALITRRRGRPAGGLSERWRPAAPGAKAPSGPVASDSAARFPWRTVAAPVFALLVLVVGYNLFQRPAPPPPPAEVAAKLEAPVAQPGPAVVPPGPAVVPPPASVAPPAPSVAAPAPSVLTQRQTLEKALAPEVQDGLVSLAEEAGRTTISIRDDRQFGSGNVEPAAAVKALAGRIGEALERVPGPVLVRGYTDSVPVKPGAFPSNLALSAARAKAAAALIAAKLTQPERVTTEGAGEAGAIAPNDTEPNRSKNRRVAIIIGPGT